MKHIKMEFEVVSHHDPKVFKQKMNQLSANGWVKDSTNCAYFAMETAGEARQYQAILQRDVNYVAERIVELERLIDHHSLETHSENEHHVKHHLAKLEKYEAEISLLEESDETN